ncbi:MAG: N-acetyl-gamma-glutamyl-phosphate reductase [Lewinellaceae bacterium]|nr:N-acetyl-gamma-glutamyl-phosphate reductase [Lewinellaceae bacterium]
MIKTGIVGATGYTGSELVRLLYNHPEVDIRIITSESRKGERFSDIHPHFQGLADYELQSADKVPEEDLDAVFLALPHGVSMDYVKKFAGTGLRMIDLSGDFRLSAPDVYESWYGKEHTFPQGFKKAVYGLPELHRDEIRNSRLVANPGCYPTSAILGLAPLVKNNIIIPGQVVVDSKSGVTGAGVKAKPTTHYSNVSDNFKAYGLKRHRHTIEIEEQLSGLSSNGTMQLQFTPHLLPVDRGILSTIYTQPREGVTENQLKALYADFYKTHPFVRLRPEPPALKDVRGSNFCDLFVTYDERTNRIITLAVIDNLVKGAAGQAMQNMNLMFGLEEETGFVAVPLNP